MSSILKALKKLEREKSQQRDDHIDLARDIFRGSESRRGPDWLTLVIAGAVALTLVAVILFVLRLMERDPVGGAVARARPVSSPVAQQSNDSVIEEIVDQRRPQMRAPAAARRPAPTHRASEVATIPAKGPDPVVVEEILSPPPPTINPVVPPVTATATSQLAPAPEGVVLTAIVFQAEREARIAVINDLPVMEGSWVGEFKVEEILIDRVILSHNGTHFVVHTLP